MVCKWNSSVFVILLWVLFASGCDESLPPRNDPVNILQASFTPPHEYIEFKDGNILPPSGMMAASIKNLYTEVLQKEANIQVIINIWMANAPEHHQTVVLTSDNLAHPSLTGNLLTLLPNDSARVVTIWDPRTDEGVPFWQFVPLNWKEFPGGERYQDSDPVEMVAQASIQVFDNVQPRSTPPIHYICIYRLYWSSNGNS